MQRQLADVSDELMQARSSLASFQRKLAREVSHVFRVMSFVLAQGVVVRRCICSRGWSIECRKRAWRHYATVSRRCKHR